MAQLIKQGNIFGRIGTGFGKGLAEQIPKEIERNRLSQGLQQFSKESGNRSPIENLASLSAIPGVTPQMIQSFSELAKQNATRQAYARASGAPGSASPAQSQDFRERKFGPQGGMGQQQPSQNLSPTRQNAPTPQQEESRPQIVSQNPLDERARTRLPWSPQQRNASISNYMNQGFTPEQSSQLASDDESRDLSEPGALQRRQEELKGIQGEAREAFRRQLENKLQKRGDVIFDDLTGEMVNNLERGMERDLATNPKYTVEDVANKWSQKGLAMAEAKGRLKTLASTTGIENFLKSNTDVTLKKIEQYQKIFEDAGNLKEFKNLLQSDLGMSPYGASWKAYPRSPGVKKYIDDHKPIPLTDTSGSEKDARKAAIELQSIIKSSDSILAIMKEFADRDFNFDQVAFMDQMQKDQDDASFTDLQKQELAEGPQGIKQTWGDVKYLPIFRRK